MTIHVQEVVSRRDLKRFIALPYRVYHKHPYWVPPLVAAEWRTLRKDRNPAFEFCEAGYWLAYEGQRPVGRIAVIRNRRYIDIWGQPYARFGWLDFEDDPAITDALFSAAGQWARQRGLTALHGPLGFTDLDREGMLIEGFDRLGTAATAYNFPYYPMHMDRLGFRKDVDWVEYELRRPPAMPDRIARLASIAARRYGLRTLAARRTRDLLPYARGLFEVLNVAYKDIYGFVPLTERQMDWYIEGYLKHVRVDCVRIVLDPEDRVAAFGISMPSLSRALQRCRGRLWPFGALDLWRATRAHETIDFCLVGIRPEWQGRGAIAMMMHELGALYLERGFVHGESNPELERNTRVQALWRLFDGRPHKRRRCYLKDL